MIVQCPLCKSLFDLASFQAEGGVLTFTCVSCGGTPALRPAAPAVEPVSAPPAPRRAEAAPEPQPYSTPPAAVPEEGREGHLNAAWNRAVRDWDNPRAHEVFVAFCASVDALPFAGTRYRDHLKLHPDDKLAQKGRDRVLAQAVALAANRRDTETVTRGEARSQWYRAVVFVSSAAAVGLVAWQVLRMSALATDSPE